MVGCAGLEHLLSAYSALDKHRETWYLTALSKQQLPQEVEWESTQDLDDIFASLSSSRPLASELAVP